MKVVVSGRDFEFDNFAMIKPLHNGYSYFYSPIFTLVK